MTTNPIRDLYRPAFDTETDEWLIHVPADKVAQRDDGSYAIRLPLYLTRTYLSLGGAILRPLRRRYRDWLLKQQGGVCAICGAGAEPSKGDWNLDHQPPLKDSESRFIDYERVASNRVIHRSCDVAQLSVSDVV